MIVAIIGGLSGAAVRAGAASASSASTCSGRSSPFIVLLLLNLGLFIPMGWGAPQGPALVVRNSVSIVPSVAGEVIDVPVEANTPLKAGDVLFRIDPVPYRGAGQGDRGATETVRHAPVADDATVRARFRPRLRRRAAAVRSRPAQGAARRRAVESGQDRRARAGRRLRHQPRAAQGRAGRQPAAGAGDGLHRHVEHDHRRRDRADRRPLYRSRASRSRSPSSSCRADLYRQGRERAAGDRDRTGADLRTGRGAQGGCSRAVCRPHQARRRGVRAAPAGRQHRRRPRSSPNTSRRPTSSARCCCGRSRSSTTSIRSECGAIDR